MTELQRFIQDNPDTWEHKLSTDPYNLQIKRENGLALFKYNQIASDMSLKICQEARGIILYESDWLVACRAFDKFFNWGESQAAEIDWSTARIQEKVDGCVHSKELIYTDKGQVPVEKVINNSSDYEVLTWNHDKEITEFNAIEAVSYEDYDGREWYEVELENGSTIKLTGNHRVWLPQLGCYRRVDEMREGDEVQSL